MDERTVDTVPQDIIDALDASVRDVADGNLLDAALVQAEARRMLADHERTRSPSPVPSPAKRTWTA